MNDALLSPRTGGTALELSGLTKQFKDKLAVDDVSLAIPAGSMTGLVGPNGAGKTTALSMAVGLLRPDAGTARVGSFDVWEDPERAKRHLGILPDGLALPERLTGSELLNYWGLLRGMDPATVASRAAELLRVMELDEADHAGTLIIEYSTGMRKKLGLATALLHRPSVLVLDEPYEAVDPVSARVVTTILRRFIDGGGTVIISSHVMALVEQLCDRVAIISSGKVLLDGTLDEVRGDHISLENTFVSLVGERSMSDEDLAWL